MKVTERLSEKTFEPVAIFEIGSLVYTAAHPVTWKKEATSFFGEGTRDYIRIAIEADLKNEGASEEQIKEVLDWMYAKFDEE